MRAIVFFAVLFLAYSAFAKTTKATVTPAGTSTENTVTPAQTSTETPAQTSTETPAQTSTETPAQTSTETPAQTSTETPAQTPTETPAQTPTENTVTPTQTSTQTTQTPAQTSTGNTVTPTQTSTQTTQTPAQTSTTNSDDTDVSDYLGVWTLTSTNVNISNFSQDCCIPTGSLIISNNTNGNITITSTSWANTTACGVGMNQTIVDLQDDLSIYNLTQAFDANKNDTLTITYNNNDNCQMSWFRSFNGTSALSASMISVSFAGLIALVVALIN